jgi:hypothetical protein
MGWPPMPRLPRGQGESEEKLFYLKAWESDAGGTDEKARNL